MKVVGHIRHNHKKNSFFDFTQNAFWAGPEAENEFKMQCEPLKHSFFDLNQVEFRDGQEAKYDFKVTCEALNIAFSTSPKSHLGLLKRKIMSSQCLATT